MKRNATLLLITLLTLAQSAFAITKEELATILKNQTAAINDIQVDYEWSVFPLPENREPRLLFAVKNGATTFYWATKRPFEDYSYTDRMLKFISGNMVWHSVIRQSYCKPVGRIFQLNVFDNKIYKSATIIEEDRYFQKFASSPFAFTLESFNRNMTNLPDALVNGNATIDTTAETCNDYNAIRVDLRLDEKTEYIPYKLYFSTDHDYALVKIEAFNAKGLTKVWDIYSLREAKKDIWFPDEGKITDVAKGNATTSYKAFTMKINYNLPDSLFYVKIPEGTPVNDKIKDEKYDQPAPVVDPTEFPKKLHWKDGGKFK